MIVIFELVHGKTGVIIIYKRFGNFNDLFKSITTSKI